VVRWNDQLVWSGPQAFHPPGLFPPAIADHLQWTEAGTAAFSGRILACEPIPLPPSAADSAFVFSPYWIDRGLQPAVGAIRLRVELPADLTLQPLLVSGPSREQADYLLVRAPLAHHLALTYVHTNAAAVQSKFVEVDNTRPQLLELELPSLYPPENDEFFAACSLREIAAYKSRARLKVNGVTVLEANVLHYEATPGQLTIGEDKLGQTFGPRFTGHILSVDRSSLAPPSGFGANDGPLEMELTFPGNAATSGEAILATGDGSAMDVLLLKPDNPAQAHFELRTAHGVILTGQPMRIDSSAAHKVQVTWGGFYPESTRPAGISPEEWRRRQHIVTVSLDGAQVLSGQADFLTAARENVSIGQAAGLGAFSGRLQAVRRLPSAAP
jgi:hypothetical protein